jgi:molybdopterin synthase catalytic subunit
MTSASPVTTPRVRIQQADFDVAAELAALQAGRADVGALASFTGCVRSGAEEGGVNALTLEHYPGMTERAIEDMVAEASRRFRVLDARVIHRVGRLEAGARIVLVAVASSHRRDAFQACEFLMDYLKTHAPFWKKESTPEGERWVDARVEDDEALERWGIASANAGGSAAPAEAVAAGTGDNERHPDPASTAIADDASLATLSRANPP